MTFTTTQIAAALRTANLISVAQTSSATPEQYRSIVEALQGADAAKRKDPGYLTRYQTRVLGWIRELTADQVREIDQVVAPKAQTLSLSAAMVKLGCWSADNAPTGATSVKLVELVTGQTMSEEEAVSTVRGWLGGLPSGELRRLKIDLAIAKKQAAETSAKGAKVIPITSAKGAKKEEVREERPAPGPMGDNRPKGLVFAAIYDCLHREDGASKEEIRKELRKLEKKGISTMELMESTLRTQLSRMGKERGFEITRSEVEGRGRVYRAVYANRCAA